MRTVSAETERAVRKRGGARPRAMPQSPGRAKSAANGGPALPRSLHAHLRGRLKGWLTWDDEFFIGPRYIRLLEAVAEAGTIRGACPLAGMSYRTCLNRIRRMERIVGGPVLVITRGGAEHGSATLTPGARELIRVYRAWRRELEQASDEIFARLVRG